MRKRIQSTEIQLEKKSKSFIEYCIWMILRSYKFPLSAWSRSIASKRDLKLPAPKPLWLLR